MTDIVDIVLKLRLAATEISLGKPPSDYELENMLVNAAAEIERLRAALESELCGAVKER